MTIYIAAASFEERCLGLPSHLQNADYIDRFVLLDFAGYQDIAPYAFNLAKIEQVLTRKRYQIAKISVRSGSPLSALSRIEAELTNLRGSRVLFDISAMPRNYLFTISRLLAMSEVPTTFRYYRPVKYGSELSRGVKSIKAIPGFEGYKALYAWERISPTNTIALLGSPPYESSFLNLSRERNRELLEQVSSISEATLNTYDVIQARDQLQKIYDENKDNSDDPSFIICPLGSKLQSLATFAFAYRNQSVAVTYVSSLAYYTDAYSRGFCPKYKEVELSALLEAP